MTAVPPGNRSKIVNKPALSGNLQGALWMIASSAGYTVHLALVQAISAELNPVFLGFMRGLIALGVCAPFVAFGVVKLSTARFPALVVRSLIGSAAFVFGIAALAPVYGLHLAEFNALSFTRPLFVTLLAAVLLKETVGVHRTIAVIFGFIGVLIMTLVPGLFGFGGGTALNLGSLMALAASLCFALTITLMKSLTQAHKPAALLVWSNLLSSLVLLPFAALNWETPGAHVWGLTILMALTALVSQFCFIKGMSMGDASFLSPIDYLRLPMSSLADWLIVRTLPGPFVWFGAAIIVISTLYITWRETLRGRATRSGHEHPPKPL
jgi:drug/metabolite transporter (DMT)-like permease